MSVSFPHFDRGRIVPRQDRLLKTNGSNYGQGSCTDGRQQVECDSKGGNGGTLVSTEWLGPSSDWSVSLLKQHMVEHLEIRIHFHTITPKGHSGGSGPEGAHRDAQVTAGLSM
jgi:hypothetical protein